MLLAAMPLAIAALVAGWSFGLLGPVSSIVVACLVGIAGGVILGTRQPEATILALMVVTVFLGSPIVDSAARYVPALACMIATVVALVSRLSKGQQLKVPALPVSLLLIAYLVMGGIATVTSVDVRLSAVYLAGMVSSLTIAFVAAPTLLATATSRVAFIAMAAAIGLFLAAASIVLWLVGPVRLTDEPIGVYLVTELRIGDLLTGVIVPRASGPYLAPSYQALNLSIGLFSLLALRPYLIRWRVLADLGIALLLVATLLTMGRGGWFVAAMGSLVIAFLYGMQAVRANGKWTGRPRIDRSATASFAVMGLALGLLLTNAIGADARYDLAKIRYGDAASGSLQEDLVTGVPAGNGNDPATPAATPVQVRGGAESSSRGTIWSASLSAISARPLTGYGPGTNAEALVPFLTGPSEIYRGLTSHSTWLRTALEMGVLGLILLIGFVVAAGWVVVRNLASNRLKAEPWSVALIASAIALVVGQLTETLLLGGLTFASLYWAMAIGILVAQPSAWQFSGQARRSIVPIGRTDGLRDQGGRGHTGNSLLR
jgi:hypothetical protein